MSVLDVTTGEVRAETVDELAAIAAIPIPVPATVTPAQAKLALHAAGLLAVAEAAVSAAGVEAQIYWSNAQAFERQNEWVIAIGAALSLSSGQIDGLFRDAATR